MTMDGAKTIGAYSDGANPDGAKTTGAYSDGAMLAQTGEKDYDRDAELCF